jgi:hypothetical protein
MRSVERPKGARPLPSARVMTPSASKANRTTGARGHDGVEPLAAGGQREARLVLRRDVDGDAEAVLGGAVLVADDGLALPHPVRAAVGGDDPVLGLERVVAGDEGRDPLAVLGMDERRPAGRVGGEPLGPGCRSAPRPAG